MLKFCKKRLNAKKKNIFTKNVIGKTKILLVFLTLTVGANGYTENIVTNGNFAKGMRSWTVGTWMKNRGTVKTEKSALIITNTSENQRTVVYTQVKLKPKTKYIISFQIKGDIKDSGNKKHGARFELSTSKKHLMGGSPAGRWQSIRGKFDWKNCVFKFRTKAEDEKAKLFLILQHCIGTVSFANIKIENEIARTGSMRLIPQIWQNNLLNIPQGFPAVFLCDVQADPKSAENFFFEVDLPKGIDCIGASPWHFYDYSGNFEIISDKIKRIKSKKAGYNTFRIKVFDKYANSLRPDRVTWENHYRIYLQSASKHPGGECRIRFYGGNKEIIKEQSFRINVLAPLPQVTSKLDRFKFFITYLESLSAPSQKISDAYTDFWLSLAKRPKTATVFAFYHYPEHLKKKILDNFETTVFFGSTPVIPLGNYCKWEKDSSVSLPKMVNYSGKEMPWPCPEEAMRYESPIWHSYLPALVKKYLAARQADSPLMWNFEPTASNFCFCKRCRAAFSKYIKKDEVLSATNIRKKHMNQWLRFRVAQHGKIANNYARAIKKYFPNNQPLLCTDPQHVANPEGFKDWCGVDCRLNDKGNFGRFMNMFYSEGVFWFDEVEHNHKLLKTPQIPLMDPTEKMEVYYVRYTPAGITMNMVAAAAIGVKGIGFWPGDNFDGSYLHAIVNAVNLIAPNEDCYKGRECSSEVKLNSLNTTTVKIQDGRLKKNIVLPDFAQTMRYRLHESNGNYLLTVFNYDKSLPMFLKAKMLHLQGNDWNIVCCNNTKMLEDKTPGTGFVFKVPAYSVRLYKITRQKVKSAGIISKRKILNELAKFQRLNKECVSFKAKKKGKAYAGWGILKDKNVPLIKLAVGIRSVYLDPSRNAAITGCFIDSLEDILYQPKDRGMLDELNIYKNFENLKYNIEELNIKDGVPYVVLTARVPHPDTAEPDPTAPAGICIKKRVSLENNGSLIRSTYKLTNPKNITRKIITGARIRHYPRLGASWNTGKVLNSFWTLQINAKPKNILFRTTGNADNVVLKASVKTMPGGIKKQKILPERYTGGAAILCAENGRQKIKLSFEMLPYNTTAGFMFWWGSGASTVEPLTIEKSLNPGESMNFSSTIKISQ